MLKKYNFFDKYKNKYGDFKNDFKDNGNGSVTDRKTGLMWQQSGSHDTMKYKDTDDYIRKLNRKGLGGYRDWRLPTLEELASLLEKERYINPVFDKKQQWCWSSDKRALAGAWRVSFSSGEVYWYNLANYPSYVRAVRVRQ